MFVFFSQREIKQNKGSILKASVDYIKELRHEVNRSKELEDKFRQMTLLNRKLVSRIKELEAQNSVQQSSKASPVSPFSPQLAKQIKQEPQLTLLNLVTSPQPQTNGMNTHFQQLHQQQQSHPMLKQTTSYGNGFFYPHSIENQVTNSWPGSMQSPQNYQQSPQSTFNQQVNNMSAVLNDAVLDDLLTSPVTDPMLCNNMYAENMMDALSGI